MVQEVLQRGLVIFDPLYPRTGETRRYDDTLVNGVKFSYSSKELSEGYFVIRATPSLGQNE